MVEHEAVRHPPAAVVPDQREAVVAERPHRCHLVGGHRALGVVAVALAPRRFLGVAVAAQVRRDDGEALGQPRRDPAPGRVRLRVAVQEQERRPRPADRGADAEAVRVDVVQVEACEERARLGHGSSRGLRGWRRTAMRGVAPRLPSPRAEGGRRDGAAAA